MEIEDVPKEPDTMQIETETGPAEAQTEHHLRDRKALKAKKDARLGRETSFWSLSDKATVQAKRKSQPVDRFTPDTPVKSPKKPKTRSGDSKPKPYRTMFLEAVRESGSKKGPTMSTISKYVHSNYQVSSGYSHYLSAAASKLIDEKVIVKDGQRYKLAKKGSQSKKKQDKRPVRKSKAKQTTMKKPLKKTQKMQVESESSSSSSESEFGEKAKKKPTPKKASPKITTPKKTTPKKTTPKKTTKRVSKKTTEKEDVDTETTGPTTRSVKKKSIPQAGPPPGATAKRAPKSKPALTRAPSTTIAHAEKPLEKTIIKTELEIIFCFDTTGSMYDWLENVQTKIGEIVSKLLEDIQGIRIGIIALGDYEQTKPEPYVIKIKDFTTDVDEIVSFIFGVEPTYGGDWEEAYELALKKARTKFSWSPGFKKALVVIGDAVPHGKDEYKKIDWEEQLDLLIKQDIRVYGVQCNTNNEQVTEFFKQLAERSGGEHLSDLHELDSLEEIIKGLCYREAAEVQYEVHEKEIIERISRLKRQGSAEIVLPTEMDTESSLTDADVLAIHNAIHDPNQTQISIAGVQHDIAVGHAGCRFADIEGLTFIQQNTEKDTKYAKMAKENGNIITWIVRGGRWGLIIDQDIVRR